MKRELAADVILLINIHHKAESLNLPFHGLTSQGLNEGPGLPGRQQILGGFSGQNQSLGRMTLAIDGLPLPQPRLHPTGVLTMLQSDQGLTPPIHGGSMSFSYGQLRLEASRSTTLTHQACPNRKPFSITIQL
jgi:hypothetical protein